MQIKVKLNSILSFNRFEEANVTVPNKTTLRELIAILDIAVEEVCIATVNGKSGTYNQFLNEGDRVSILPFITGG